MQNLFSYGTLQLKEIQMDLFQRALHGTQDKLVGYKKAMLEIPTDKGGSTSYPVIDPTENPADIVEGVLFQITDHELQKADEYEGPSYRRITVMLASRQYAWVYVRAVLTPGA
jgi:gamma-glutamylcyclotransferase (GGCT)/AIG2-like uncharacterized protein YtfP